MLACSAGFVEWVIAVQIGGYLLVRVAPLVGAGLRNFPDVTAVADLELHLLRIDKAALDGRTRLSNTLAAIRGVDQAAVAAQGTVKIAAGTRQTEGGRRRGGE